MFVKPGINPETGKPFRVRIPHTFALMAEDGQEVPEDMFWTWMKIHGDVVDADPPPVTAVEQPKAEAETPAEIPSSNEGSAT